MSNLKVPRVLWIDDQRWACEEGIRALRENSIEGTFLESAHDADELLKGGLAYDIVICDVMMPAPSDEALEETKHGLDTGIWLLRRHAAMISASGIGVLVLTNRLLGDVKDRLAEAPFMPPLLELRSKLETPTRDLAAFVIAMFQRRSRLLELRDTIANNVQTPSEEPSALSKAVKEILVAASGVGLGVLSNFIYDAVKSQKRPMNRTGKATLLDLTPLTFRKLLEDDSHE